jgi:hypothetical protein
VAAPISSFVATSDPRLSKYSSCPVKRATIVNLRMKKTGAGYAVNYLRWREPSNARKWDRRYMLLGTRCVE